MAPVTGAVIIGDALAAGITRARGILLDFNSELADNRCPAEILTRKNVMVRSLTEQHIRRIRISLGPWNTLDSSNRKFPL